MTGVLQFPSSLGSEDVRLASSVVVVCFGVQNFNAD
jgi:hypothetical protein